VAQRTVIVFSKAPQAGLVKTRLAEAIGIVEATRLYRVWNTVLLRNLSTDSRWRTLLAVTPDGAAAYRNWSSIWPPQIERIAQGKGDLGERMARMLRARGEGPILIVGADAPDLTRDEVWRAFRALGDANFVFGPSTDGGYWLVGADGRTGTFGLFNDVRWSTSHALSDSVDGINGRHKVAFVRRLMDIDTGVDLEHWKNRSR
jgi:hypothetical protein